jgi:creatinine amidohydrolase
MGEPRIFQEMTSPELAAAIDAGDVVVIPVGSIEQHGPHLPVDTDIRLPVSTALAAARRRDYLIVAPPVSWGLSGNHTEFAGYLTLRSSTFMALLHDLCTSLIDQGFRKIVLIVGHAGNKPAVSLVVNEVMHNTGVPVVWINNIGLGRETFQRMRASGLGGDWHAGELETALVLHDRPDLVKLAGSPGRYVNAKEHFGLSAGPSDIFAEGGASIGFNLAKSFPDGVAGDPTLANAELGKAVFDAIVEKVCFITDEYHDMPVTTT